MRVAIILLLLSIALTPSVVSADYGCTDLKLYNCTKTMGVPPICGAGQKPVQQPNCCFNCRPGFGRCTTPVDPVNTPVCAAGVEPTIDTNYCPTCIKSCGAVQLQACFNAASSLPTCDFGVKPVRDPQTCCFNCMPAVTQCTKEKYDACDASRSSLPVCTADAQGVFTVGFNTATCCATCRRPDVKPEMNALGKCTDTAMKACLAAVPICLEGQKPFQSKDNACCPSCKRPESLCTVLGVVQCQQKQPVCGATEKPVHIDGDCCASCRPSPPTCASGCTADQLCIRAGLRQLLTRANVTNTDRFLDDSSNAAGECVNKVSIVLTFKEVSIKFSTFMKALAASDYAKLLNEAVDRFCDNNGIADRCNRFRAFLRYMVVTSVKQRLTADGVDTVTVDIPAPTPIVASTTQSSASTHASAQLFRDLIQFAAGDDSPAALLTNAATDPSASGDVSVGLGGNGINSASSASVSVITMLVAAVLAFIAARA